tara:strand:+ start:257 stop:526 length:270 start_codon:yes stop_codon:yes gene_type:complete
MYIYNVIRQQQKIKKMKNYKFTLSPNQETNLQNVVLQNGKPLIKKEKTIFADNKSFADVLAEGIIFAIGTATALLIATGFIIIFSNLIY